MPVISGSTLSVARDRASRVTFRCLGHHESETPGGVVSIKPITVAPDEEGVVTSPDLESGPVRITIDGIDYDVTLGDEDIDLWTLIAGAVGAPIGTSTDLIQDAVEPLLTSKADAVHAHVFADVPGLQSALNSKASAVSVADALEANLTSANATATAGDTATLATATGRAVAFSIALGG